MMLLSTSFTFVVMVVSKVQADVYQKDGLHPGNVYPKGGPYPGDVYPKGGPYHGDVYPKGGPYQVGPFDNNNNAFTLSQSQTGYLPYPSNQVLYNRHFRVSSVPFGAASGSVGLGTFGNAAASGSVSAVSGPFSGAASGSVAVAGNGFRGPVIGAPGHVGHIVSGPSYETYQDVYKHGGLSAIAPAVGGPFSSSASGSVAVGGNVAAGSVDVGVGVLSFGRPSYGVPTFTGHVQGGPIYAPTFGEPGFGGAASGSVSVASRPNFHFGGGSASGAVSVSAGGPGYFPFDGLYNVGGSSPTGSVGVSAGGFGNTGRFIRPYPRSVVHRKKGTY